MVGIWWGAKEGNEVSACSTSLALVQEQQSPRIWNYVVPWVSNLMNEVMFVNDIPNMAAILFQSYAEIRSRDSVVGIATSYGLYDRGVGVRVPVGPRIFCSPNRTDRFWGPPNLLFNGYRGLFSPGVKRPGREAEHSPPTSAEVKIMWSYKSTPPNDFIA
jgi:hypothetical protein